MRWGHETPISTMSPWTDLLFSPPMEPRVFTASPEQDYPLVITPSLLHTIPFLKRTPLLASSSYAAIPLAYVVMPYATPKALASSALLKHLLTSQQPTSH